MSLFFRVNNISVILVVWDHTARNGAEEGGGWRWQPEWDKWRWTEEGDHRGRESEKMCQMQKGRWQRGWIRERVVGTESDSAVLPLFILTDAKGVLENVGGKKMTWFSGIFPLLEGTITVIFWFLWGDIASLLPLFWGGWIERRHFFLLLMQEAWKLHSHCILADLQASPSWSRHQLSLQKMSSYLFPVKISLCSLDTKGVRRRTEMPRSTWADLWPIVWNAGESVQ